MNVILPKVTIRPLTTADVPSMARHLDDRALWLCLSDRIPHPYLEEHGIAFLKYVAQEAPATTFGLEVDGEVAGTIAAFLQNDVERGTAEIGYWLGRAHWGKGIGTQAVAAFVAHCFQTYALRRLYARCFSHNVASIRVLEKAGFVREGVMRDAIIKDDVVFDQVVLGMTRADFQTRA